MKFDLIRATDGTHKYIGIFTHDDGTTRRIPFGAKGYQDYTQHKDPARRQLYRTRHRARENWRDPQTAGALSRYILWGDSTSLETNIRKFKSLFSLA